MLINTDDRMAEICCGIVSENETMTAASSKKPAKAARGRSSSRAARRRRMEIRRFRLVSSISSPEPTTSGEDDGEQKRRRREATATTMFSRGGEEAECDDRLEFTSCNEKVEAETTKKIFVLCESLSSKVLALPDPEVYPKYGVASVCGRRRVMEDTIAVHPFFFRPQMEYSAAGFHFCGVYDGHGCSHVAMRCRERLHELVREELEIMEGDWGGVMERSFTRMDREVVAWSESEVAAVGGANCRCELQAPDCDAVGSTAVVAVVTPEKIVVANCGDSRAVLCRNGKPVPLSSDHKPDRPDELDRIQAAGGRVIYWDGPRVLGVLAMSRAIGDNYLKPYVSCKPEVTVTERTPEDDCLILATDGLWDVVSNETACGVARMCLKGKVRAQLPSSPRAKEDRVASAGEAVVPENMVGGGEISDKACAEASMLLMRLALARQSTDNVSVVVVDLRGDP